jgi:glycyl-tRNA synthetase beta subunit
MNLPDYVTKKEVQRVCKEIGLKDWTQMNEPVVTEKEASAILKIVNEQKMDIPLEDFRQGLEVELEHGTRYPDANVTNNHPVLTGKIVIAHLKETMDYYKRLEVVEIEGDILKAVLARDINKILSKYKKLAAAQELLADAIAEQLPSK